MGDPNLGGEGDGGHLGFNFYFTSFELIANRDGLKYHLLWIH